MTIEESIDLLDNLVGFVEDNQGNDYDGALILAINTMRKYQKIEDIYYHQSGEALENSLRAVIEDGKID